jgi:hypothetical protein
VLISVQAKPYSRAPSLFIHNISRFSLAGMLMLLKATPIYGQAGGIRAAAKQTRVGEED